MTPQIRAHQTWFPAVTAACAYFSLVFAAGFGLGTVRTIFLAPMLGQTSAVLIEMPLILAVAWITCGWTIRRFAVPDDMSARLTMGLLALLLLLVAELLFSVFVVGRSPPEHFAMYGSLPAQLGLLGQLLYGIFPVTRR